MSTIETNAASNFDEPLTARLREVGTEAYGLQTQIQSNFDEIDPLTARLRQVEAEAYDLQTQIRLLEESTATLMQITAPLTAIPDWRDDTYNDANLKTSVVFLTGEPYLVLNHKHPVVTLLRQNPTALTFVLQQHTFRNCNDVYKIPTAVFDQCVEVLLKHGV